MAYSNMPSFALRSVELHVNVLQRCIRGLRDRTLLRWMTITLGRKRSVCEEESRDWICDCLEPICREALVLQLRFLSNVNVVAEDALKSLFKRSSTANCTWWSFAPEAHRTFVDLTRAQHIVQQRSTQRRLATVAINVTLIPWIKELGGRRCTSTAISEIFDIEKSFARSIVDEEISLRKSIVEEFEALIVRIEAASTIKRFFRRTMLRMHEVHCRLIIELIEEQDRLMLQEAMTRCVVQVERDWLFTSMRAMHDEYRLTSKVLRFEGRLRVLATVVIAIFFHSWVRRASTCIVIQQFLRWKISARVAATMKELKKEQDNAANRAALQIGYFLRRVVTKRKGRSAIEQSRVQVVNNHFAKVIQRWARLFLAKKRKRVLTHDIAVCRLQCFFRRVIARRRFLAAKSARDAMHVSQLRERAALAVQRFWRMLKRRFCGAKCHSSPQENENPTETKLLAQPQTSVVDLQHNPMTNSQTQTMTLPVTQEPTFDSWMQSQHIVAPLRRRHVSMADRESSKLIAAPLRSAQSNSQPRVTDLEKSLEQPSALIVARFRQQRKPTDVQGPMQVDEMPISSTDVQESSSASKQLVALIEAHTQTVAQREEKEARQVPTAQPVGGMMSQSILVDSSTMTTELTEPTPHPSLTVISEAQDDLFSYFAESVSRIPVPSLPTPPLPVEREVVSVAELRDEDLSAGLDWERVLTSKQFTSVETHVQQVPTQASLTQTEVRSLAQTASPASEQSVQQRILPNLREPQVEQFAVSRSSFELHHGHHLAGPRLRLSASRLADPQMTDISFGALRKWGMTATQRRVDPFATDVAKESYYARPAEREVPALDDDTLDSVSLPSDSSQSLESVLEVYHAAPLIARGATLSTTRQLPVRVLEDDIPELSDESEDETYVHVEPATPRTALIYSSPPSRLPGIVVEPPSSPRPTPQRFIRPSHLSPRNAPPITSGVFLSPLRHPVEMRQSAEFLRQTLRKKLFEIESPPFRIEPRAL